MDEDFVVVEVKESSVVATPEDNFVTLVVVEPSVITDEMQSVALVESPEVHVVSDGQMGPRGLQGLPGVGGSASFEYAQASAAALWTINHNLGFRPTVGVFDSGGLEVDAEIQHITVNQVTVSFTMPLAGTARLV